MVRVMGRVLLLVSVESMAFGQQHDPKKIKQGIDSQRQTSPDKRGSVTRQLALEIRVLLPKAGFKPE